MHFVECCLFLWCIHKLKNIKNDFNIRYELYTVLFVWFFTSYVGVAVFIYSDG